MLKINLLAYQYRYYTIILGFIFFAVVVLIAIFNKYLARKVTLLKIPLVITSLLLFASNNWTLYKHNQQLTNQSELNLLQNRFKQNDWALNQLKTKLNNTKDSHQKLILKTKISKKQFKIKKEQRKIALLKYKLKQDINY